MPRFKRDQSHVSEDINQIIEKNPREKIVLEGRYLIRKKISQGGFGKVYLAIDKTTNDEVVVKVNAESEMNDSEFKIMKHLSDAKIEGFPKVFSSGTVHN